MGGGKPAKVDTKGTQATSQYKNTGSATFESPFGTGFSQKTPIPGQKNKFDITAGLKDIDPRISGIFDTGLDTIRPNMQVFNKTPEEQYATAEQSPLYAQLQRNTQRDVDIARGRALVDAQKGGLSNSTVLGSALGTIQNNAIDRNQANLLQALQQERQMANENIGVGGAQVGNMYNLISPLTGAASGVFNQALGSQDKVAMNNAANMTQIQMQNAQLQQQANMQTPLWASLLGSAMGSAAQIGGAMAGKPPGM